MNFVSIIIQKKQYIMKLCITYNTRKTLAYRSIFFGVLPNRMFFAGAEAL